MKTTALIAAGGIGERFGAPGGKQLLTVAGKPLAAWAIQAAAEARGVDELVVVCDPDRTGDYEAQLRAALATDKPLRFTGGGPTRTASIAAGLTQVSADADYILVHDGARPLAKPALFDAAIDELKAAPDVIAGIVTGYPVSDTLKAQREPEGPTASAAFDLLLISSTVERAGLWQVQTPQVFCAPALRDAYRQAADAARSATDDAGLLEAAGYHLAFLLGPRDNVKVTVKDDLKFVEALLCARSARQQTDREG